MKTDTSEKGLETLIVAALTGREPEPEPTGEEIRLRPLPYGGMDYVEGDPRDYDREHAVDFAKLLAFLRTTQLKVIKLLGLEEDGPKRQQFLHRLQGEIARRGVIEVLRHGVKHGPASVDLFYGTPTPGNTRAEELFRANIFSVTRQLRYSKYETQLALDLVLFINGLPIATFELKNRLTKQTVEDAIQQYQRDRDPKELLFQFGRCVVHFAVDDHEARMCTHLKGRASWFLPFNKTLEIFGEPYLQGDQTKHRPFHSYTMKQAIQEGFILDVLKSYTPVKSYYRLMKTVEDDPEFDTNKARKKLHRYVESHEYAIRHKAEIMIDHFHEQVLARRKIGGQARAMIVTSGIKRAIQYYHAFSDYLRERKSPYQAIIAFSGEHDYGSQKVTEASLNGFPSNQIPERFRQDPYRFLIVADKFLTGYDEPVLHTMYVDKPLAGIKAVQTLLRLNRAHPQKHDTFVLDFMNDADTIQKAFEPYYRTTILSKETDPNKLHDLKADLDDYQIYAWDQVEEFVALYLTGADRDRLDPVLDTRVATYNADLDEDGQVDFKGKAKVFVRTYNFLASILPYTNSAWEKLSIFLNFLIPKLPAPREEDLAKGVLEAIDMESYRAEVRASLAITLADQDAEIEPVPTSGGSRKPEPEIDRLSNIIKTFNDLFGNIDWKDADKIHKIISEEIPAKVAADKAYRDAVKNSDKQNARIEHDRALQRVILDLLSDHSELFKQFSDNASFKKWLSDTIFNLTYEEVQ